MHYLYSVISIEHIRVYFIDFALLLLFHYAFFKLLIFITKFKPYVMINKFVVVIKL